MTELQSIFLTSGLTIVGGILVFVAGQVISRFFIDPIHEQKQIIGQVADALIYYSEVYQNPNDKTIERRLIVANKFRQLATLMESKTHVVAWYGLFTMLGAVRPQGSIEVASKELIRIAQSLQSGEHFNPQDFVLDSVENIKEQLKLRIS